MSETLVGAVIDRYRVVEQLGRGGMGEVYVARDETLNRTVALKSIRREHRLDAAARARFLREARVLSQLQHPNICRIYDFIERPEADFLVLELIHGRSLGQAMRDGLPFRDKLRIAEQLAGVLVAAHEAGIVHRDLKPDNVMLTQDDVVKVLDFGLSRSEANATTLVADAGREIAPPDAAQLGGGDDHELTWHNTPTLIGAATDVDSDGVTALGMIMGTLGYMSPEQARGELATPASDLYSLGLVLQELFTGRAPYAETADGASLLRLAQAGETLSATGIDPDLAALIERLKSRAPAARPSAVETRERLRWIAEKPLRQRRKLLVAAAMIVLVLFSAAMAVQTVRARRAEAAAKQEAERASREAARASREAEASRSVSTFLTDLFKVSDPGEARGSSVTARELLDKGAAKIKGDLRAQPQIRARLMDTIGMVYLRLGLYDEAEPLLRDALAVRTKTLSPLDPELAQSDHDVGILCWFRRNYTCAEAMFRDAIAIREKALGADDPELAKSLNSLAIIYKNQGRLDDAERLYLRSLHIMEKRLGPNDPDLATILNNLASFYFVQDKHPQAEALLRRSLAIKEKSLGSDHPDVASTLNNVAKLLASDKKFDEAATLYRRSLAIREKVLGPNHPDVAESLANVGSLAVEQGKLAEAEPLLLRSLEIRERVLGPTNADVGSTLGALAMLREKQGRLAEADTLYTRAETLLTRAGDASVDDVRESHAELRQKMQRRGAGS